MPDVNDMRWLDPTGERVVRRHVAAPEFQWLPDWDAAPELIDAMQLRPDRLRREYSHAVLDLYIAVKRGRGAQLAAERLLPFALALYLRGTVSDDVRRGMHDDLDLERRTDGGRGDALHADAGRGFARVILPPKGEEPPLLLTVAQAVRLLGKDPATVTRWARAGKLPGAFVEPVSKSWRIPVAPVLERCREN
jgi:hypothetical protein